MKIFSCSLCALLIGAMLMIRPLHAEEEIKLPASLDQLASKATETVDVTLDSSLLQLAARFLSNDDPDEVKVKKLVARLKGVYVRSFEFAKDGEYSPADVESIRQQLKKPAWSRIVGVRSIKGENSEVYLRRDGDAVGGLVVIDAEPKELTIVVIDGPLNIDELSELSGHIGIPKLGKDGKGKRDNKQDSPKNKEEE